MAQQREWALADVGAGKLTPVLTVRSAVQRPPD